MVDTIQINNTEEPSSVHVQRTRSIKYFPLEEKLHQVQDFNKSMHPCIKGNEGQYLHSLLLKYQEWFDKSLESSLSFDEVALKIEKLGKKRYIRDYFEDLVFGKNPNLDEYESSEDNSFNNSTNKELESLFFPESQNNINNTSNIDINNINDNIYNEKDYELEETQDNQIHQDNQELHQDLTINNEYDYFGDDDYLSNQLLMDEALAIAERAEKNLNQLDNIEN